MIVSKKVVLHFPSRLVDQPIIYRLIKEYDLTFNILKASVIPDEEGLPTDEEGKLEGVDAEQWSEGFGQNGEGGKQYAVMVVASKRDTVYAAREYFGILDPAGGFIFSYDNPLNELSSVRIITRLLFSMRLNPANSAISILLKPNTSPSRST